MLAVLEPVVGAQRPQEGLLPRVLGPLAEQPPQVTQHLVAVREVEALERRDRLRVATLPIIEANVAGCAICEMRRRRSRRMGRVRASAALPAAGIDRPRDRDVVGAGRRRRGRRAPAGAARRPLRALHGARQRRARPRGATAALPRSASTCTSSGAARRGARGRTSTQTGERTITVLGDKLLPRGPLPLTATTSCSSSPATARRCTRPARRGFSQRRLRELSDAPRGGVPLDLLVGSLNDPGERYDGLARREDCRAHRRRERRHRERRRFASAGCPAETVVDTYGAGDSFAAALLVALARGDEVDEAITSRARAGSAVLGGAGPYTAQLA